MRCIGRSECIGLAVQHARLADREIRDVDHLLHFAVAFGLDLAGFQRHQAAERALMGAQLFADQAHGSPRFGAGTMRHCSNALRADTITARSLRPLRCARGRAARRSPG
jgi:hypothetical protein